jgi:serine/threonine protein kinase/WD40 repeat protein
MESSDSLRLDENLARFLAAYDQEIDGGDPHAATLHVPRPLPPELPAELPAERPVTPLRSSGIHEGSLGELLPDSVGPVEPVSRGATTPFPTPPPGGTHRIGRFELRRQLGKGGCGIVFLAYDPKLQREVALKLPRPEMMMNPDAKRRLIREGLAAAEFDHPNLVPVYETGEIGPLCFIATAFCPGRTLADWLDRQAFPVPVRQAARLVATVAEAVQHAHDRGVLHRDLKPNNVILQELKLDEADEAPPGSVQLRGEQLLPRLVDFGLAKLADRGGPSETGTRQILGTPKYMAPEQAQARREDIGPPADVYALGVILYELITGRAPYDGETDVEVLRQAIEGRPPAPRALRPDVPRDLEAICLKAMAKHTAGRYRTAIDFADDLRRFLDGRPTVARPLAWSGRAVRWLKRNDQLVAILALALVVVFVTGLGTWNSWTSEKKLRLADNNLKTEQDRRNRAEQEREYSRQLRDAFLAWRSGNPKAAADALDAAARSAGWIMEAPEFAHAYLSRLAKAERLMIVCPAGAVTALAVSADGGRLASGHADGTLAVWDRATGKSLGSVQAHRGAVTHAAFADGGKLLLTAGPTADGTAMLGWAVGGDGAPVPAADDIRTTKDVHCLAVSPDGTTVYAGGRGGLLRRMRPGAPAANDGHDSVPDKPAVTHVAVSADGKRVFTAAGTRVLCWTAELAPGDVPEHAFPDVTALAVRGGRPLVGLGLGRVWAPDADRAESLGDGGNVQWIATGGAAEALSAVPGRVRARAGAGAFDFATGDAGDVRAGVFTPDGKTLFTGSADGVIRAWDLARDGVERGALATDPVAALAVSIDGREFVTAGTAHVRRYEFDPLGEKVAAGDAPGGSLAVRILEGAGGVRAVSFDGRAVVVRDLTGNTGVEQLRAATPDRRTPVSAALSADGGLVAVGDDGGRVNVWSVSDRKPVAAFATGTRAARRMAFSDDGKFVAAPTAKGVGVWSLAKAEQVADIAADEQAVFRVLPAGDRLAVAGRDGAVRVWNFAGREELTMFGHVGRVTGLGVSPNGRTIVSGGLTGEVKFWDARTGMELIGLRRHSSAVTQIEFAAEGRVLVTAGDGQFATWDARE